MRAVAVFLLLAGASVALGADSRPNIIFIHSDSVDGRMITDPDSPANMPNLRRFMQQSTTFENTYSASPECNPSRSTLWSGRRVDHVETWNNGKALPVQYPILFDRLWANNYTETFIGRRDFNQFGDSFKPRHQDEAPILHHTLTANLSAWLRAVPGFDIPNEMRPSPSIHDNNDTKVHTLDWSRAASAAQWLQDRKASGETKPFALSVGFIIPHPAYVSNNYWVNKGVDESKLRPSPHLPVDEQPWPLAYDSLTKNVTWWSMDYWSQAEILKVQRVYAAMCAEMDAITGVVLDAIDANGYANNTIVVFWGDHGDLQMTHWSWYKESVLEGSARVPLIVRGPGIASGKVVTRPTSLLDIFPTVLDVTDTPYPTGEFAPDGYSLVPDLVDSEATSARYTTQSAPHPPYVITQWHGDHSSTGQFAVRQGDWKYIYYSPFIPAAQAVGDKARHQPSGTFTQPLVARLPLMAAVQPGQAYSVLFNVSADPNEMVDVRQQHQDVAQQLHNILLAELQDPDAIDALVKAWDKCMWAKWRSDIGQGNVTKVMEIMGNPGNRFWWVWRSDPDKWFGLLTDWERSHGGPNFTACADPFHTVDDDGPKHWDDDVPSASMAASWTFPDPLSHWPLSNRIDAGPEDFKKPLDLGATAASRLEWAQSRQHAGRN